MLLVNCTEYFNVCFGIILLLLSYSIVIPIKEDMRITGLPDVLESGTVVKLTCTINRIKPASPELYWTINGLRVNGTMSTDLNNDGSTLKQENVFTYR